VRRKNQCMIVARGTENVLSKCNTADRLDCRWCEVSKTADWCRFFRVPYYCTSPDARNEAATKLVKVLRKKYGVSE
jgi:hypothetical protein